MGAEAGLGLENTEKIVALSERRRARKATYARPAETISFRDHAVTLREASDSDVSAIQELYREAYEGKYTADFAVNPATLSAQIRDPHRYFWLIAADTHSQKVAGAIVFLQDAGHRLGKAAGVVVSSEYRGSGLGSALLERGVRHLTEEAKSVDVVYALSRTVNEAPSRVVAEVGFRQMGIFPNAVQVDNFEHLNLDVYLTEPALRARRKKPYLVPEFQELYQIAREQLGLERAAKVTERAPLALSPRMMKLKWTQDKAEAERRFRQLSAERRVSNSFFPFHWPNAILSTEDGGTEVFVSMAGVGKQAAIVGYRTDRENVHDLLDSVAGALQKAGAGYVELLVDAYNYRLQQEAFTARFIPSAYFPAMKLNHDGRRDDLFVLSRTFHLMDFTHCVLRGANLQYLRAYLRHYQELYLKPILEN